VNLEDDFLPISLVLHTIFCERRTWLEANGERTATYQMEAGFSAHRFVDNPTNRRSTKLTSMPLRSERLGLVGKADAVEVIDGNQVSLVEYKSTPVRKKAHVTPANRLQLTLQRSCLEEAGFDVVDQSIFFTDHHRKIPIEISDNDISEAEAVVEKTRAIVEKSIAPPPLLDDERCFRCSHFSVCLPDEQAHCQIHRRINVADPDGQVLHLTVQGSRASLRKGRVVVKKLGEKIADAPLGRVVGVVVHGNIDISSALHRNLLWNDIPTVWCSSTGRVYGFSKPTDGPNAVARINQHILSSRGCLDISRGMIKSKILNQATLLRRNGNATDAVAFLQKAAKETEEARDNLELLGIEGEAASRYFEAFPTMLKPERLDAVGWHWPGRHGRGASDPINILLNYCYGLLKTEVIRALLSCGLDPHAGFLHSCVRNKPAMALDLMEEFRAPIADSVVTSMINRREIGKDDFVLIRGVARLKDASRKKIISAFERRIQTSIKHPIFDYDATWRRVIEIQARMVLGVLTGTQSYYEGVTIR